MISDAFYANVKCSDKYLLYVVRENLSTEEAI